MADFSKLLVVETTTGLAGPLVGRYLADLGAQVVKVESAARVDNNRRRVPPPGMSATQLQDVINVHEMNAGKSSVALNLKTERGRASFLDLLARADIYLENFVPGWLERIGLSHRLFLQRNPRLIILAQSAYGETGPHRDRRAYAHIMTALAGVESIVGYPDGRIVPQQAGAVGDVVAANFAILAVLAALYQRSRTDRGAILDMSQTEASTAIAGVAFAQYGLTGEVPLPDGNEDPRYAPHGVFPTAGADEWVALSVRTDHHWHRLCQVLALPPDAARHFADGARRLAARDAVNHLVRSHLAKQERATLLARLREAGVPCAPVLDCYQAEALPEFMARGLTADVMHPHSGRMQITNPPWRFDRLPLRPRGPFEPIGASTERVLRSLTGIDDAALRRGQDEGAFT